MASARAVLDLSPYTGVLPYASELTGTFQPMIGWKGARSSARFDAAAARDKRALLDRFAAQFEPKVGDPLPASRRIKQIRAFEIFFTETYNSVRLAEQLVREIKLRGTLREKLRDAGKINRLQQAHHIIPIETVMQSRLVQKAVLEGFEINGIENGIVLSIAQHKRRHSELASYNRYVLQELFNLEARYPNCSRKTAKREVNNLVKLLKNEF